MNYRESQRDPNKSPEQTAMVKEVSALNTYWIIQYLKDRHPEIDIHEMFRQLTAVVSGYVENLKTGKLEQVTLKHLQSPRYWFSNDFVRAFYDIVQEKIPDPLIGYKIGRTVYKSQPVIKTTVGVSLLGVKRVAKKVASEAAKFNRTKTYEVTTLGKGHIGIRVIHNTGIVTNRMMMEWNAGCFHSYATLAGATKIKVVTHCVETGPKHSGEPLQTIWDFEIRYQEPGVLFRLTKALLRMLPWVRDITEKAEQLEYEHQEQILNRDRIIKERTEHLASIQNRLLNEERNSIEQKLQEISLELVTTEERERRAIAQDLHDSVTQMIGLSLSRIKSTELRNLQNSKLQDIQEYLEQALGDLRSLTFQISPPVLYDFGLEAALDWLILDINKRHNMKLIFVNLLDKPLKKEQQMIVVLYRAVREMIINILKHGNCREGKITIKEEDNALVIVVADSGVGFDPSTIKRGFGLCSLQERVAYFNGRLHINSRQGEGSTITIIMPN